MFMDFYEDFFDVLALNPDAHFTQGLEYGSWQEKMGHRVRRFVAKENGVAVAFWQMVAYQLPMRKTYLYIPHGPVFSKITRLELGDFWKKFSGKMREVAKKERAVFLRFDPLPAGDFIEAQMASLYSYRASHFQPKFEWVLDLSRPEEELMRGMHKNTRYSIRMSEKSGVICEIIENDKKKYFAEFWALLNETAKRDNFGTHPKKYYEMIFESPNTFLVIARLGSKTLAVNVVYIFGKSAYYLFAASSGSSRNVFASYAAQWVGIREARERGRLTYNFGGVADPAGKLYKGWRGITHYKENFGGRRIEYSNFYDIVFQPFWYRAYILRKRLKA